MNVEFSQVTSGFSLERIPIGCSMPTLALNVTLKLQFLSVHNLNSGLLPMIGIIQMGDHSRLEHTAWRILRRHLTMRQFPSHFVLKDLTAITSPVFELKHNAFQRLANEESEEWFKSIGAYDGSNLQRFLSHKFDDFAGLSFPDADQAHLVTCINFFFWAFSFDDLADEGESRMDPDSHQRGVDITLQVFRDSTAPRPDYCYAAMLYDIWTCLCANAPPGVCQRFAKAAEDWCNSQVQQSTNRALDRMPSVAEFIFMRRNTIGGAMVEAMVEYATEVDLPAYVFEDPIVRAMSDATNDLMTWPNDICSFNKEQADDDYQNLVCCAMEEYDLDLQSAIDHVTRMISDRLDDYANLKKQLPSFGPSVDLSLQRYLTGLEHFTQGTIEWYYSPRYFRGLDLTQREDLVVPVYKSKRSVIALGMRQSAKAFEHGQPVGSRMQDVQS